MAEIKFGVLPYDDGSGSAFEIRVDQNGSAWIETSSTNWVVIDKEQWPAVRSALNQAFRSHDKLNSLAPLPTQ